MSYEIEILKSVEVLAEAEDAFGINQSGTLGYTPIRIISAEMEKNTEMLDHNISRQKKFDRFNSVVGRKMGSLNLQTYMYGAETALSATIAPGAGPDYTRVLQTIVGGRYAQSGSYVTSSVGAAEFGVESIGCFKPGQIVGRVNSSGKLEARMVRETNASNQIELHTGFSETPSEGDQIYGSYTYYLQQSPTGSLQALVRGAESDDVWVFSGMQGTFSFGLELRQMPTISFQMEAASWFSGAAGAATRKSYANSQPPHFSNSDVLLYASSSSPIAATSTPFTSISVTPNLSWINIDGAHGVNNIVDKVLNATENANGAMTIELTLYYEDLTLQQALERAIEYGCLIQIGSRIGQTVVIACPRMQVVSMARNDANGIVGQTITLAANHNSFSESDTGYEELAESPFVIALL